MLQIKNTSVSLLITVLTALTGFSSPAQPCQPGKQVLVFKTSEDFNTHTTPEFTQALFEQLQKELSEIGYCLVENFSSDTSVEAKHLFFTFTNIESFESEKEAASPELIVALLENEESTRNLNEALSKPLVSFVLDPQDLVSLKAILVKKIAENLRNQYVCHIRIHASPEKVHIKSTSGLNAVTPVEWIQPLGDIHVHATKEGYEPVSRKLELSEPGLHTFYLQLEKRQFYHSNFFYTALATSVASVVFFSLENHYHESYRDLDRGDYTNTPERFGKLYRRAKTFEYLTLGSLLLTGASLGLSFKF
ncbi:MAG: hypothetical protein ACLFQB_13530 [Chitinispirillaceae bacterium]